MKLKDGLQIDDRWTNTVLTVRSFGKCIVCRRQVFGYESDSAPDPRGLIHPTRCHSPLVAEEYGMVGDDVSACFDCMNTAASYRLGLERAKEKWKALSIYTNMLK